MKMLADLRHAVRGLRKAPALSAVAIASLALGIGANVTAYSVAREMIFDDISAVQPDRLARIDAGVTYARYRDLRAAGVFQDLAFDTGFHDAIWQRTGRNEVVWAMDTSPNSSTCSASILPPDASTPSTTKAARSQW